MFIIVISKLPLNCAHVSPMEAQQVAVQGLMLPALAKDHKRAPGMTQGWPKGGYALWYALSWKPQVPPVSWCCPSHVTMYAGPALLWPEDLWQGRTSCVRLHVNIHHLPQSAIWSFSAYHTQSAGHCGRYTDMHGRSVPHTLVSALLYVFIFHLFWIKQCCTRSLCAFSLFYIFTAPRTLVYDNQNWQCPP